MTRRSERPLQGEAAVIPSAGGRWRVRNWRLRTKLLVMLLIPSIAVLVLVALRAKHDLDRANLFAEKAERVRVETTVVKVVHQLQRERDLTIRYVAEGRAGSKDALREQRSLVDEATGEFDRTLSSSAHALSHEAISAFREIDDRLEVLTGLRYAGENTALPADGLLRSYGELISGILDIGDRFVFDTVDGELSRSRLASNALARVKDQMSVRRAVVMQALADGSLDEGTRRALSRVQTQLAGTEDIFMTFATPGQRQMYTDTVIGLVVDRANGIVQSVLVRAETGASLDGLSIDDWDTASTYTINLVKKVQDALLVELQDRSDALAADARRSAGTDAGVVLGALLIAAILAVVITRSLLRPLRTLRCSALNVAETKLPAVVDDILTEEHPTPEHTRTRAVEPVPVFTRDELGEVARAFDAVHGEAVRLAGEQAMLRENINSMFVNLSRRSQELVERQLTVLDRMEEHEQDPDILGGLYELDHLATRMRRNSENLLVLGGEEAGRPLPGAVPASEIVGAALSEVEHYQRISVQVPPALSVQGNAAADLIHVISELFENATRYSPESEQVSVVSSVTRQRQWRIQITDRGASMPDTEIDRANARLAAPPDVDVEVSRRMGLFVVGRLSARHDIEVTLAAADPRGLTATVLVPAELVEQDSPAPIELPPSSAAADAGYLVADGGPSGHEELAPSIEPDGAGAVAVGVLWDHDPPRDVPAGFDGAVPAGFGERSDGVFEDFHSGVADPADDVYAGSYGDSHGGPKHESDAGHDAGHDGDLHDDSRGGPYDVSDGGYGSSAVLSPVTAADTAVDTATERSLIGTALDLGGPDEIPVPDESAPPRRRTVELGAQPAWPIEDGDAIAPPALEEDVPTDRLPAYAELLSRWFPDVSRATADDAIWARRPDDGAVVDEVTEVETTMPTTVVPAVDAVPGERPPSVRRDVVDRREQRPPPVNRSPEAVRARMTSLQNGARKGRHDRGD